ARREPRQPPSDSIIAPWSIPSREWVAPYRPSMATTHANRALACDEGVGILVAVVQRHDAHDHDVLRSVEHGAAPAGLSAVLRQARRSGAAKDHRDGAPQRLGSRLARRRRTACRVRLA